MPPDQTQVTFDQIMQRLDYLKRQADIQLRATALGHSVIETRRLREEVAAHPGREPLPVRA